MISTGTLTDIVDQKVAPPSVAVLDAFNSIIKETTEKNHKRRCVMEQVRV